VAVASVEKENEKTEAETSTPVKPESLCDPGANVPTSSKVVPVKEVEEKTEEESQAEQEVKSDAATLNKEEEKTKKRMEGEEKTDREEGDKPFEPDSDKSENASVPEVQSSSPKPDQFEGNKAESMEVSSDVDVKDRQQKESDEKVSLMYL
jgi:hypothetical protein